MVGSRSVLVIDDETAIQESLEMIGAIVFIKALLVYLNVIELKIDFKGNEYHFCRGVNHTRCFTLTKKELK